MPTSRRLVSKSSHTEMEKLYMGDVLVSFSSNFTGLPSPSFGPEIVKQCSTDEMVVNSSSSAKYRPGHILIAP